MTKQSAFDFSELQYLEVTCGACRARTTLDAQDPNLKIPVSCAACYAKFEADFYEMAQSFIGLYRGWTNPTRKCRIRVIVEDQPTTPAAAGNLPQHSAV